MITPVKTLRVRNETMEEFRKLTKELGVSTAIAFDIIVREFLRKYNMKKGA